MDRADAIRSALHSMQLEGFTFTTDELALWQRVAAGELSLDDLIDVFERFDREMKQRYPEKYEQERQLFRRNRKKPAVF